MTANVTNDPTCPTCSAAPGDCGHCPKCGGELFTGYGLMGGGIGAYEGCTNDDCDYFDKTQDTGD
jgi:hypothetical protein